MLTNEEAMKGTQMKCVCGHPLSHHEDMGQECLNKDHATQELCHWYTPGIPDDVRARYLARRAAAEKGAGK